LYYDRLKKLVGKKGLKEILEMMPYVALDIEEQSNKYVKVEYNPNRPDFSTDYGIARALRGMFGIETGVPKYQQSKGNVLVNVDASVKKVRPFIVSMVALEGRLDDEGIRQIIAMQEDIHEGIGRKRKKVSIGIHNYDVVKSPILYSTENPSSKFVPLNSNKSMSMKEILENIDVGRQYAWILKGHKRFPVIKDAEGNVLSFPPIINSELTKVTESTKNLFIDITATDLKAAEDALAILAITLYEAKFKIQTVKVNYGGKILETPNMKETVKDLKPDYANKLLGLKLNANEIAKCLAKSRIGANMGKNSIKCRIPRYRIDIMHSIDLVEELAIGYGIYNMNATYPRSSSAGARDTIMSILDKLREGLSGLGMIEVMNFSLVSKEVQYSMMKRGMSNILAVEQTKSIEHEVLRDSLIPSLMFTLSKNIHEPYPQRIFEVGKVFFANENNVKEYWSVAGAIAHKDADYTEAKSYLQALLDSLFNIKVETRAVTNVILADGKSAEVVFNDKNIGMIGEIKETIINNFKMRVPVSVFEINMSYLLKI
ncbi:MAG: phenylalanine--tRNA ligase subunit beta, partial [Nitrososphaerales archaeon]